MENLKEIKQRIVEFIRESVGQANAKGIVLGLSGGIDSALVAALAKEAVGRDNVLGIIMPCNSNPKDKEDGDLVAKALGINTNLLDLSPTFNLFTQSLGVDQNTPKLTVANIKPRLRMTALYYYAAKHNYLVAGTGNKSEITVGYFTKHGDSGVDILPIASLVKAQVWELSKIMGIPEQIINKAPSAGLWDNQTDEEEMGITYRELDEYIITGRAEDRVKERVDNLNKISQHKREFPKMLIL